MDWLSSDCWCGFFVFRAGADFVKAKAHFTPQDRADYPGKNADEEEGYGNKSVIVSKDFLGEEKSQSRQRQGREESRDKSQSCNGGRAADGRWMPAYITCKHYTAESSWNEAINIGHEQRGHRNADSLGIAMDGAES